MFNASASASPAPSYQWTRNGVALAGATEATLILANVTIASAGAYQCVVTNAAGSAATEAVLLTVVETAEAARLRNFSVRVSVRADRSVVAGFVVGGPGQKTVLIRGLGPALAAFGVSGVLTDPKLEIFNSAGQRLAENDNWPAGLAGVFAPAGAFALPAGTKDAAVILPLQPGAYNIVLSSADGASGEGLVEIYEAP